MDELACIHRDRQTRRYTNWQKRTRQNAEHTELMAHVQTCRRLYRNVHTNLKQICGDTNTGRLTNKQKTNRMQAGRQAGFQTYTLTYILAD